MNFFGWYFIGALFMYGVSIGIQSHNKSIGKEYTPNAPYYCAALAPVCAGIITSKIIVKYL